ncbi:MAG: hypothetical protein KAI17_03960 [Thiotrichaceae bacterium]|nr:hypothetical protein [Thiotrichaceae bacterium]
MEEYLLFASIGGLLFLTVLMSSVAEAYEIKQREKRILILKIKNSLDDISHILEKLKPYSIPKDVNNLLLNEIIVRLQKIQLIDRHFHGIQTLLEEARETYHSDTAPAETINLSIKTEQEYKEVMIVLRHLIKLLASSDWLAGVSPEQLNQYTAEILLFRCEKIVQFYTDKANILLNDNRFLPAKENYSYILSALKSSGIIDNPRVMELTEQAEFMKKNVAEMMSQHTAKMRLGEDAEENKDAMTDKTKKETAI